ncbi:hypothetical protein [Rosettibacter firmus]|uniref:hypothetical protein n=1 Tax=Rosettibacter firmus TaxID=3111522 RepID=UPI00336BC53A
MKKYFLLITLILCFNKINAQEEDIGWVSRFGIAVGFNPAYVFPDLSDINTQIKKMGIDELSNSGLILWGGSGYAYIMMIEDFRIGAIGLSGSTSTSGTVGEFEKEVKYNFGLGGLTFEYTLPFIKNVAVSLGAIVGYGSSSIEIYQSSSDYSWENVWSKVNDGIVMTRDVSDILKQSYLLFTPTINCDIPLTRFFSFRIGGGYNLTFNRSWKVNNNKSISGMPSGLNSNSFFIQTGIYFGFFAY